MYIKEDKVADAIEEFNELVAEVDLLLQSKVKKIKAFNEEVRDFKQYSDKLTNTKQLDLYARVDLFYSIDQLRHLKTELAY